MSEPGAGSLWEHTAGEPIAAPPIDGDRRTDVVVVGGGYTGISAALHLAEAGAEVCLLEAMTMGHGGSGRNVGLVNAGLWLEPDKVESALGAAAGRRLNDALAGGPALVFGLIDRYAMPAQATRTGTLHCAHSPGGFAELERRHLQLRRRNAPVELLTSDEAAGKTGSRCFHGALLDRRAGTVQPLAYLRGLAAAALAAGARLHERSAARSVEFKAPYWTVRTDRATVRAEALLLATNAYHRYVPIDASPRYTAVNYFQVSTDPLAPDLRKLVLPERQGAWDTAAVMSSFRLDAAGRLIVGAIGSLDAWGSTVHRAWVRRKLFDLFPAVGDCEFRYAWTGRIAMTNDHIPKVVGFCGRALSIYGYSGRGIAPGTVFGKAAAAYFLTGDEDRLPLTPVRRHREVLCGAKAACIEVGASISHFGAHRRRRRYPAR